MSRYLKNMIRAIDDGDFISPSRWEMIIDRADDKTLKYLESEGFETIKYFNRDDWMDIRTREDLKDRVFHRLSERGNEDWFKNWF